MDILYSVVLGSLISGMAVVGILLYRTLVELHNYKQMVKGAKEAEEILAEIRNATKK